MNNLIGEMVRSLGELQLGFKGELQMSEQMEALCSSLYEEKIAPRWQPKYVACRVGASHASQGRPW